MDHVLLTRARGQNESLASRLEAMSLAPVIEPMLEVEPRPVDAGMKQLAMDLDRFDHVIFVSRNAVHYGLALLDQYWPQWPSGLKWHAVGQATAEDLRARDLSPAVPDQASSEGLLASGVFDQAAGAKILIVRGDGGREYLAQALTSRGAEVSYLQVYQRRPRRLGKAARRALEQLHPEVAVVYSGETLEALIANLEGGCGDVSIVVPSDRVGKLARASGFKRVVVAAGMDEVSMAEAVQQALDPDKNQI